MGKRASICIATSARAQSLWVRNCGCQKHKQLVVQPALKHRHLANPICGGSFDTITGPASNAEKGSDGGSGSQLDGAARPIRPPHGAGISFPNSCRRKRRLSSGYTQSDNDAASSSELFVDSVSCLWPKAKQYLICSFVDTINNLFSSLEGP